MTEIYTKQGVINILDPKFQADQNCIEPDCNCYTCQYFSLAYVHHMSICGNRLGPRLIAMHNIKFAVKFYLRNLLESGIFDLLETRG